MLRPELEPPSKFKPCPDVPESADIYRGAESFSHQQMLEALLAPIKGDYDHPADGPFDERNAHPCGRIAVLGLAQTRLQLRGRRDGGA